MIVEKDGNLKIEQTSDFKRKAFSITSSAEAFRILSKGIYSDPITAVIRELSTNAVDGHMFAVIGNTDNPARPGQDLVPFDVYLPTRLEPSFRVRDYGIGLSEEQVFNIYTTYFESNKRDSNDFNGSLGLGSKSPFALVSSFLVTSFYQGTKTVYSAIIGEDGCPDIVKMTQTESDEPTGVEVKMTISPDDIWNFEHRAKQVYQYFDLKPNVYLGKTLLSIPEVVYDFKTDHFGITRNSTSSVAIQANVAYTIDTAPLVGKISEDRLALLKQYGLQIHLFFDNGSVNFVASREHLEYTPRTIAAIDKKIDEMLKLVQAEFDEIRNSPKTLIEATYVLNYDLIKGNGSKINRAAMVALANGNMNKNGHIMWGKTPITRDMFNGIEVTTTQTFKRDEVNIENGVIIPKFGYGLPFTLFDKYGSKVSKYKGTLKEVVQRGNKFTRDAVYLMPVGTSTFILNDSKLAQYKLVEYINKNAADTHVYVFHPDNEALMKQMMRAAGVSKVVKTSDIDIGEVERRQLIKTCRMFTSQGSIVDKALDDLTGISYYVVAKGSAYTFHMFDNVYSYEQTQGLIKDLAANNIIETGTKILVLPASSTERLLALFPHLKPLEEVIKDISWKNIPEKTRITLLRNFIKTSSDAGKSNFISEYSTVTKNLERIEPKDTALQAYIKRVQDTVNKVKKQLDKMNDYQYRYASVDEAFTKLISKRLGKDSTFLTDAAELKEFVEIDNQARKIFPIIGVNYVANIRSEDLTRYVESDWQANQHEL